MSLRQLFPAAQGDPDLAELYAYPDGPWLRANMVSSADGAASLEGASAGLSSDTDRRLFALLRTLSDVILVGAATARAERYKPARPPALWRDLRDGRAPTPPIAVVSRRLDLDPAGPLIADAPLHARTIVITTTRAPGDRREELARHADVIVAGDETVDLKAAVGALADRGHRRLLAEGGPHLLGQLTDRGLQVNGLVAGHDDVRVPGQFGAPVRRRLGHSDHDRAGVRRGRGDQRAVRVEVEPPGDHGYRRCRRPAVPQVTPQLPGPGRLVLLLADRGRADQDDVRQRAQQREHPPVGIGRNTRRDAVQGRGAVNAGHHVGAQPPAVRVGVQCSQIRGGQVRVGP